MTGPAFTIEASQFKTLLQTVAPAVMTKRTSLAVLSGVHLTATPGEGDEPGTLRAWATDLTMGVVATAPAVVREPGSVVVAHDLLAGLAARLAGLVACRTDHLALAVEAGSVKAKVRTIGEADDMPVVPIGGEKVITMPAADLLRAIERTAFAANATDPGRATLYGLFVGTRNDEFRFAAADGFVLAVTGVEGATVEPNTPPVLIPAAAMSGCLAKLLKGTAAAVDVRMVNPGGVPAAVWIDAPAWRFYSRLIGGTFPDFTMIVSKEVATTVTVDAEGLAKAIRTVRPFATVDKDDPKSLLTRFAFEDGEVRVSTTDADRGESTVSLGCQIDGPGFARICLNATYVLDVLDAVGEGAVEIGINGRNQAVVFREGTGIWVVMPIVGGR